MPQKYKPTGQPNGRPLTFKTAEALQAKIDEFFAFCDNRVKEVYNKELGDHITISNPAPYTMSGLAYAIGIDRRTLIEYGKREEFYHTIKRAKERVEADVEARMSDKETFTPGLIFNAKNNFGWVDKQELDHTSKGEQLGVIVLPPKNEHNPLPETTGSGLPDRV